jgi:hypothetical protein
VDRLATGNPAHGWFAFAGGESSAREIAARIAAEARRRGLDTRTVSSATTTRVTVSFPEGRASLDVLEVPRGGARNRLAICRRGAGAALTQTRALVRETLERCEDFGELLTCDEATAKSLPELAAHRAAVRARRAADVIGALGWLATLPALLAMGVFVFFDLGMTRMTCGPEPIGAHAGELLTVGVIGVVAFAAPFIPAVLLLRHARRTLARSIAGAILVVAAVVIALADVILLAVGTSC